MAHDKEILIHSFNKESCVSFRLFLTKTYVILLIEKYAKIGVQSLPQRTNS